MSAEGQEAEHSYGRRMEGHSKHRPMMVPSNLGVGSGNGWRFSGDRNGLVLLAGLERGVYVNIAADTYDDILAVESLEAAYIT